MLLPKLGGAELLQLLKGDPHTAKIPVVVLSRLSQKNELELMAAGAAAYLKKSSLALDQCSSELSRTISKILSSVPASVLFLFNCWKIDLPSDSWFFLTDALLDTVNREFGIPNQGPTKKFW